MYLYDTFKQKNSLLVQQYTSDKYLRFREDGNSFKAKTNL